MDSTIVQSEVWSQRIAQRKRLHFLADLWSQSEFRTQRNAQRKTDPKSETRTVLTRRVSSYGLPAALSDYGVNAAGIAEIVVIFRNDSSLAEMPGSFA